MTFKAIFAILLVSYAYSGNAQPADEDSKNLRLNTSTDEKTHDVYFWANVLLGNFNETIDQCDDMYSSTCTKIESDKSFRTSKFNAKVYSRIRYSLINILSSAPSYEETKALSVEKKLFQSCMKLGVNEDGIARAETKRVVEEIFDDVLRANQTWQEIDKDFYIYGFSRAFFDITIERDPEDSSRNIILLKPSSYARVQNIDSLITIALNEIDKKNVKGDLIWSFFHYMNRKHRTSILTFLRDWLKIYSVNRAKHKGFKNLKTSIKYWNNLYNEETLDKSTAVINWTKMVTSNFADVGLKINDEEMILITDKNYFLMLRNLLAKFSNDEIASLLRMKTIIENLRYIDWSKGESLIKQKRSFFCFEETKLYGLSFQLLRDLKKTELAYNSYYKTAEKLISHIVNAILSQLSATKMENIKKDYLKSEIKLITANLFNFDKYKNIVSNYYDQFSMASSYFLSIIGYRKFIRDKELSSLRDSPKQLRTEVLPFSVIDLEKPRNRFILNIIANGVSPVYNTKLPKEFLYGTVGTKIASFLVGLLNENKFHNSIYFKQEHKGNEWFIHPIYTNYAMKCLISENFPFHAKAAATQAVTETYGIRIAFKAMLLEYLNENRKHLFESTDGEILTTDQLFFRVYAKTHCYLGKQVLNTVFKNLEPFVYAFDCYKKNLNDVPSCPVNFFDIYNNHHSSLIN